MAVSLPVVRACGDMRMLLRIFSVFRKTSIVSPTVTVPLLARQSSSVSSSDSSAGQTASPRETGRAQEISQAMRSYLDRAKAHQEFMDNEIAEFEIGRRHLAVIMGEDPATFSQDDIDRAIRYLLPSGLYDRKARPQMRPPVEVIPARKAAQFGMDGRPFHSMFYTGKPNFFQLMHDVGTALEQSQAYEDSKLALGLSPAKDFNLQLSGSEWISKMELEKTVQEKLSDGEYIRFIRLMERLSQQPYAARDRELVFKFRKSLNTQVLLDEVPSLQYDASGRGYVDAEGQRKKTRAQVRLWEKGTGKVTVNNAELLDYFPELIDRQQLLFPLQFCGVIDSVDIVATVEGDPCLETIRVRSSHAGAVRLAIARALQGMVSKELIEKMRIAGLLTLDPRRRERKKPGQEGARRKYTWKKR